ncbi:MAG: tRNA pseudouridine(55) synthase TruB [Holophagales bacterium]|nr:tRNA pseudouridine(55) synthase TruB [Holophagales bacterium]MYG30579.1 tRNA pseudouridine(55) synthase TruB [Holophagales bacterium]MYI79100.1 tRNA pseudouridine(55) synthase TruB [Holophagales bacterium]
MTSGSERHGLLLVDKRPGGTSHDVVRIARRALSERKIGHCGTLDPNATGLLLLTVGRGTRLTRFLIQAPKVYEGEIQLGAATDTYDAAGEVTFEGSTAALTPGDIASAMKEFEGPQHQLPPPYSAKKIGGRKYYELARRGEDFERQGKDVEIYEFGPCGAFGDPGSDRIPFRLSCSTGAYARSLAHDLGERLGCGGHLATLRRLRIGSFEVQRAVDSERLEGVARGAESLDLSELGSAWVPFDEIPLPFPTAAMDPTQERRVTHGQTVLAPGIEAGEGDWVQLTDGRGRFLAVAMVSERIGDRGLAVVQPRIVFR